ncbi:hypothetical protein [Aurantiacibacter odishensis]|nr:hypothetical protein [Aurantiacibacter odishensis]
MRAEPAVEARFIGPQACGDELHPGCAEAIAARSLAAPRDAA